MPHISRAVCLLILVGLCTFTTLAQTTSNHDDYLSWTSKQAFDIGIKWRMAGRVGWGMHWNLKPSEAYFYDIRATLMTPEAIRAAARLEQLRRHLTDDQTRQLVVEAEKTDGLVVLIDINPREGSGIIPLSWTTTLKPKGATEDSPLAISGTSVPSLSEVKALARFGKRDYAYDLFWVVFPMKNQQGEPIWKTPPDAIELVVSIRDKQGRVAWRVNDSLRQRLIELNH